MKFINALVVKLVDTKDLKSLQILLEKDQIISDKNQKSLKIKSALTDKIRKIKINKSNITVVVGGDFHASDIKKKQKF